MITGLHSETKNKKKISNNNKQPQTITGYSIHQSSQNLEIGGRKIKIPNQRPRAGSEVMSTGCSYK